MHFFFVLFFVFINISPAFAEKTIQDVVNNAQNLPLIIDADRGIICDKDKSNCVAEGNITVTKGELTLRCRKLTTWSTKNAEGKLTVSRIEASDNVHVTAPSGDSAFSHLIEFDPVKGILTLVERNNVQPWIIHGPYYMAANRIVAHTASEGQHKVDLRDFEGHGNVLLSSPDEISMAESGYYKPDKQQVELYKNVRIFREDGEIYGAKAIVDLDTGTSKMLSIDSPTEKSGRVRLVVYPEKTEDFKKKVTSGKKDDVAKD
jgi:lipopolysaccharide export system protein LptA